MEGKAHKVVIFLLFACIFILYTFQIYPSFAQEILPYYNLTPMFEANKKLADIPVYTKFLSANYGNCNGLGNQMFRLAVHYGIGRKIDRTPFLHANKTCQIQAMKEIKTIFPNYYNFAKLLNAAEDKSVIVNALSDCCNYENITDLPEQFLIFKYNLPQYYGFFANYSKDIRYFMEFDEKLKQNVRISAKTLFMNDTSHKFCIHIRRGDFIPESYKYQESRPDFIVPASVYIHNYLRQKGYSNISLILLGQDDKFKNALQINNSIFHKIYFPSFDSPGFDMAFGAMNCDTYLISAAMSTFAWWTAYLMPEGKNVFYNANVIKKGIYHDYDKVFLPHWKKLDLN